MDQHFSIKDSEIRFFSTVLVILVILLVISFFFGSRADRGGSSVPGGTVQRGFPELNLQAKAVYVYDARSKEVLYAKNEEQRLALASLTKMMSALVASEIAPEYSPVVITREALGAEGDSGLHGGERWSLKRLLDFSLMTSSNDGMQAVALTLGATRELSASNETTVSDFILQMNNRARELNLNNTYFLNVTGLDETKEMGGAYGTAKDVSMLLEYILTYKPTLLEVTKEVNTTITSESNIEHEAKNTSILVDKIPGLVASKTGYTEIGGGNLIIAFDPEIGRPIIITVLGSTVEGRFEDMQKLVNATMEYISGEEFSISNFQFTTKTQ